MFKPRTVYDFDTDVFKEGAFITFCKMEKVLEDESGNYEWIESKHVNGLVTCADFENITILTAMGRSYSIYANELVDSPMFDEGVSRNYKILGVIHSAIKE